MPHSPPRSRLRGLTVIELLVVLAVLAILGATSVQAMRGFVAGRASAQARDNLDQALRRARAEAMIRHEVVTVCPRDTQPDADAVACAASTDWSGGWLVYADRRERGVFEPGDLLLQVIQPPPRAPVVHATLRQISFQPTGVSLNAASHVDFMPVPDSGPPTTDTPGSYRACISKPGRMRVVPGGQSCSRGR